VVSSDFESERDEIVSRLAEAFHHYESMVYLKVDATRFTRMKDDANNLFFVDAIQPPRIVGTNLNPVDGSMRFSYQPIPAAIAPTRTSHIITLVPSGQWNNTNFAEPPKKGCC
jgi:hypothetical protein